MTGTLDEKDESCSNRRQRHTMLCVSHLLSNSWYFLTSVDPGTWTVRYFFRSLCRYLHICLMCCFFSIPCSDKYNPHKHNNHRHRVFPTNSTHRSRFYPRVSKLFYFHAVFFYTHSQGSWPMGMLINRLNQIKSEYPATRIWWMGHSGRIWI